MANFQTHLTGSTLLGIGYGGVAYGLYHAPGASCVLAAGLCSVSGMLPDIDSGPGRPLREITSFLAAIVPTLLFAHLQVVGMSQESIILVGAGIYAGIRFGLAHFLKRYTVHRGMFHSLPAAAVWGEITFLLFYGEDTNIRWLIAGGVVAGYLSHLLLDEMYSVQWNGLPRLKKSFGTAVKLFGDGWWPNLSAYGKVAVLTFCVIKEPGVIRELRAGQSEQVVQNLSRDLQTDWHNAFQTPASPVKDRLATAIDSAATLLARKPAPPTAPPPIPQPLPQVATSPRYESAPTAQPQPATNVGSRYAPSAQPMPPTTVETRYAAPAQPSQQMTANPRYEPAPAPAAPAARTSQPRFRIEFPASLAPPSSDPAATSGRGWNFRR